MTTTARRAALYVFCGLIALPNVTALITDPFQQGDLGSASDAPLAALVFLGSFMAALVIGAWTFSEFRFRTPVAAIQLLLDAAGFAMHATGSHPRINALDVVSDVVWLILVALQAFGSGRKRDDSSAGQAGTVSDTSARRAEG